MEASVSALDYLQVFLGGVLVSFTPCVYPLIPITIGYIGASSAGSRIKGLVLSLIYVTGVAITYAILGLLASLTGTIFGEVSVNPVTYIAVGAFLVLFGLSMLGVFYIPVPQIFKLPAASKKGYFSVFLLGISSGLLVSPCVTPVLGSILLYLATKKNILYGTTLLVCFAYGMGLVLILAGTFSSILVNLPKSGKWMGYINKIGAAIIIFMGLYFIYGGIRRL